MKYVSDRSTSPPLPAPSHPSFFSRRSILMHARRTVRHIMHPFLVSLCVHANIGVFFAFFLFVLPKADVWMFFGYVRAYVRLVRCQFHFAGASVVTSFNAE